MPLPPNYPFPQTLDFASKLTKERNWSRLHERYQSVNILGQGTYGIVYKAESLKNNENSKLDNHVALKRTALDTGMSHGIPDTALREIAILKDMKHPNIVETREFSCNISRVYLVMELLDNDLKQYIRALHGDKKQMSVDSIKHVIFKVFQGLSYLHNNRIIHRDLKPHNILVSNDLKSVKLADFGLARAAHCNMKTLTHEVVTLWYRPPEILLGDCVYDSSIDIWSIGCILAELLMDAPLFDGENELDTLLKIFCLLGTPSESEWPYNSMQMRSCFPDFPKARRGAFQGIYKKFEFLSEAFLAEDLIISMLKTYPRDRINIRDCINHPWFDSIRDLPDYSIYSRYHNPAHVKLYRAISQSESFEDDVLARDTGRHLEVSESLLKSKTVPLDIYSRSLSSEEEDLKDEKEIRAQIQRDHLMLSLAGIDPDEVFSRIGQFSDPAGLLAPETPNITSTTTASRIDRMKRSDQGDLSEHFYEDPKSLSNLEGQMLENENALYHSALMNATPCPSYTPMSTRFPTDHVNTNPLDAQVLSRLMNKNHPSKSQSQAQGLDQDNHQTPAAQSGGGLASVVIASIGRRVSKEFENVSSAFSRLSGVLHWSDGSGMNTPK